MKKKVHSHISWFARALKKHHVLENWRIVEYPWKVLEYYFFWIKITFVKKNCFVQRNDWKQSNTQIFLLFMKVFSYDFGVPGIVHFLLFEVPQVSCLNEGKYCNKRPPFHLHIVKVFTSYYWGKEVLEKMILVLEKSLIFSQRILYKPCIFICSSKYDSFHIFQFLIFILLVKGLGKQRIYIVVS